MFISDFAIKRPVVTIVTMLALVVFGIFALTLLDTDEFPDVQPPVVVVAIPYPGRVARDRRARGHRADRGRRSPASAASTRSSRTRSTASASIIIEFVFEKDLQEATQEIRDEISGDPQRPAARDGGADPHALRSGRPADRVADAVVARR